MRKKQEKPSKLARKNRSTYTLEDMKEAYNAVINENMRIRSAARLHGIPTQSLRDRVLGSVDPDSDRYGNVPLLSLEEEHSLVEHLEGMAQLGYRLTQLQIRSLAGDSAHSIGRRPTCKPLSNNWFSGFLNRWHERLQPLTGRSLGSSKSHRANNVTKVFMDNYYGQLEDILIKYSLKDKPHLIYYLDETSLLPVCNPESAISSLDSKPKAIASPLSVTGTTTLIGCSNAAGISLPPYFVFKGKRWNPDLMEGASPDAVGVLSHTGLVNKVIFQQYFEDHFLHHKQTDPDPHVYTLLLYDGYTSLISPPLIQWAKDHNIILFLLPANTLQILRSLDASTYSTFKRVFNVECSFYIRKNPGKTVGRLSVSEIACKAYVKAMTPRNIKAAFLETGIHPFCPQAVTSEREPINKFAALTGLSKTGRTHVNLYLDEAMENNIFDTENNNFDTANGNKPERGEPLKIKLKKRPSNRGQAITEGPFEKKLKKYEEPIFKPKKVSTKTCKRSQSLQPSTSKTINNTNSRGIIKDTDLDYESNSDVEENEKCCVCKKWQPVEIQSVPYLRIVKWAQCDKCDGWVHLEYCTKIKVVRRHGSFLCPRCSKN